MQGIKTADGSIILIALAHGLPRVHMRPRMDKEFEILPYVVLTSDNSWDLAIIDFDHGEDAEEDDQLKASIHSFNTLPNS
ncbi:hypothetical protein IV203_014865 [Nitzschia inconspicua]|uniref:Uncharacterized protein n=1 Tax=Nitzschia inconspicua TaxID=303405 RepID=A0A9K3LB69_9STRA|nr:hypothetical protein IV203_014865 [Nitzschia inconspicua]